MNPIIESLKIPNDVLIALREFTGMNWYDVEHKEAVIRVSRVIRNYLFTLPNDHFFQEFAIPLDDGTWSYNLLELQSWAKKALEPGYSAKTDIVTSYDVGEVKERKRHIDITNKEPSEVALHIIGVLNTVDANIFAAGKSIGFITKEKTRRPLVREEQPIRGLAVIHGGDGTRYQEVDQNEFSSYGHMIPLLKNFISQYVVLYYIKDKDKMGDDGRPKREYVRGIPDDILAEIRFAPFKESDFEGTRVRRLNGIIDGLTVSQTGVIRAIKGYDSATRKYNTLTVEYTDDQLSRCQASSRKDAIWAVGYLLKYLKGFTFENEEARFAALAGLMTAGLRSSMDLALHVGVSSPEYGSGKSFYCDLLSIIATSDYAPFIAMTKDVAELDKVLSSCIRSKQPIIALDNLYFFPNTGLLAQLATSNKISVRPMGQNDFMDIHENNTLVLLNGNKCVPHADMIRRTLFIELQSVGERSEDRRYEGDTRDKLKTERSKVLLAIASIACAFINSREKDIRPLASHTQWDRLVRQPLLWLGFPDPIANWQTSRDHDPKRALEIELFDELAKVFGLYVDITPKDLVEKMYLPQGYDLQAIIETVMEQDKQPFSTLSVHGRAVKMGFLLGKLAGKTRNKIKMERKRGSETKPWVYVLVEEDKK